MAAYPSLRYLGPEAVAACGITPAEMTDAVAQAFAAKGAGRARTGERLSLRAPGEANFTAKGGVLDEAGLAVVKWYGYIPHNRDRTGLPDFSPLLLVSDTANGLPLALMDGHWLSAVRTAAISCAAARVLARPDARRVGFVACGAQAHSHLEALQAQFPLTHIRAHSRSRASAERLAERARALGLHAQVEDDAHAVLEDADIVVTSVPRESEPRNFLDARRVPPGCYVAMACMGFSWDVATLGTFEVLATDDYDPATHRSNEKLAFGGPFHAEIAQLLAAPRAHDGTRRSALLFAGSGLADAAAAALIYRRAIERGLGQPLA